MKMQRSLLLLLLFSITASKSGQVCTKRLVKGKWKSHGDCESTENRQSVIHDIRRLTKEEKTEQVSASTVIVSTIVSMVKTAKDNVVVSATTSPQAMPEGCDDADLNVAKIRNQTGGVFDINITDIGVTEVFCDVITDGGNWIVFQRRMDGSVDFYRDWTDYVKGFGEAKGEFWLGLEAIHQLTKHGNCQLRIDMIKRNDENTYHANYSSFNVGSSSVEYNLSVSGYSGNIRDALAYHNGYPFSTKDNDNDAFVESNCAKERKGGWWYNHCTDSNLNGLFTELSGRSGITWYASSSQWFMGFTEMKLRCSN